MNDLPAGREDNLVHLDADVLLADERAVDESTTLPESMKSVHHVTLVVVPAERVVLRT